MSPSRVLDENAHHFTLMVMMMVMVMVMGW